MSADEERKKLRMTQIQSIQDRYTDLLMSKPHVIGVGAGMQQRGGKPTGEMALVVMVDQKVATDDLDTNDRIPNHIEGVPVDVQEMGTFTAF